MDKRLAKLKQQMLALESKKVGVINFFPSLLSAWPMGPKLRIWATWSSHPISTIIFLVKNKSGSFVRLPNLTLFSNKSFLKGTKWSPRCMLEVIADFFESFRETITEIKMINVMTTIQDIDHGILLPHQEPKTSSFC